MRGAAITVGAGLALATAALAVTSGGSAQSTAGDDLTLMTYANERVYPPLPLTLKPGELRGYRGNISGDKIGTYRATCTWFGSQGTDRLSCTVVLRLKNPGGTGGGMVVVQGMLDPTGDPNLLSQSSSLPQLAVTGGTGEYSGARGYVELNPSFFTVKIP
jgi:hypothetical protein